MARYIAAVLGGLALVTVLSVMPAGATGPVDVNYSVSGGDSAIVNGWWDGNNENADSAGELTCHIAGVWSGVPAESLTLADDTIIVDLGYALSSLDSLDVPDDTNSNTPYDTIYFQYVVQNQGNTTDSLYIYAEVDDTSDGDYFTPVAFNIVIDTAGADSVVGLEFDTAQVDSAWYAIPMAQEQIDTFYVRVVIPGPANAADGDSLRFTLHVRDSLGTGGDDAWPGSGPGGHPVRTVLDTFTTARLLHTHNDTLWEYGDYQTDTRYLTINSPILRLKKRVNEETAGNTFPGDTLIYSIYYDNDGTSQTEDTVTIIDVLPRGVTFLDTVINALDEGTNHEVAHKVRTYYRVNAATWLDYIPSTNDSLLKITAIKFTIPPGVGANDTTGEAGGDLKENVVSDGDTLDADAGYMTFKVRIR